MCLTSCLEGELVTGSGRVVKRVSLLQGVHCTARSPVTSVADAHTRAAHPRHSGSDQATTQRPRHDRQVTRTQVGGAPVGSRDKDGDLGHRLGWCWRLLVLSTAFFSVQPYVDIVLLLGGCPFNGPLSGTKYPTRAASPIQNASTPKSSLPFSKHCSCALLCAGFSRTLHRVSYFVSSSSSQYCAGRRLTLHIRTLEVRPES